MIKNISTIYLNATPEKVWEVLTKPEKVKLWQYGSKLITTWQVGSKIEFVTEWQGTIFKQWGMVLEIIPNKLIRYNLFAPKPELEDKPDNYFIMNYVITAENHATKLDIIKEDNRPNAVQEPPQGEENPILQMLKTVVESK